MCNCGCNTCETKGPLLTEGKVKSLLSEGLQYHIDKKIPLFETVYRIGSNKHLSLIKEARKMYSRNVIDLCEEDEALIKTHLGEFALYEGESIPLDLPMLNEEADSYYLDNAKEKLSNAYKILGKETGQTRRGDKYLQINYIPKSSPQTQSPEFVKIFYDNDDDLKGLDLPMLKEDRKYNQEELLRLDLIARRKFDCDYEKCTDEQKAEVLKDKVKVGVKEALQEAKKDIDEAEFKGKEVALGKPKRGGPKAYYVYVKDGDKVKKVTFGSGGLRAKIKNKEARNAFAARHNCKDKKDRTKAGYWSCNLPRYASALGLGANMNTFW